jgi:hypothetical protein
MGMPAVDKLLKLPLSLQREPEGLVQLLTWVPVSGLHLPNTIRERDDSSGGVRLLCGGGLQPAGVAQRNHRGLKPAATPRTLTGASRDL